MEQIVTGSNKKTKPFWKKTITYIHAKKLLLVYNLGAGYTLHPTCIVWQPDIKSQFFKMVYAFDMEATEPQRAIVAFFDSFGPVVLAIMVSIWSLLFSFLYT